MNRKLSICLALGFIMFCLVLSACFVEYDPMENMHDPYGTYSGTVDGTAAGFGGEVKVVLTLKNGLIDEAVVTGPGESKGYGADAVTAAPAIIKATNSVELDTLSGATKTTDAIVAAGRAALAKIP